MVDPDGAAPDPAEDFDRGEITFAQLGPMLYQRGRLDPDGADGSRYQLGPSRPWTSSTHHGPHPNAPPDTADPPWPNAAQLIPR